MGQLVTLILVVVLIKLLVDNVKPMFTKNKSSPGGDFIDISEKWITTDAMPYQKNEYLLNNHELLIFKRLNDILVNSRYLLFPHVRLANLLKVPPETKNRQEYLFRIKERSLDMVIFESTYLKPVLVINLRKAEDGKQQQIADQFTEKALRTSGIVSMDLELSNPPEPEAIRYKLRTFGLEL